MINTSIEFEKLFFLYVLKFPKYSDKVKSYFFKNKDLSSLYKLFIKFYEKFNKVPSQNDFSLLVKHSKKEVVSPEILEIIFSEDLEKYDSTSFKEQFEGWLQWINLERRLRESYEYAESVDVTPENVQTIINKVVDIITEVKQLNLDERHGVDFFDVNQHIIDLTTRVPTSYTFLNRFLGGGYDPKTLNIYAGEPNIGKSIFLSNDVASYVRRGYNVMLITLEMSVKKYQKRIASTMLDIPIGEYEDRTKDLRYMQDKMNSLSDFTPPGNLRMEEFGMSTLTIPALESFLLSTQQSLGYKFQVIVVDYLNILLNYRNPNSEDTYMKLKQICEDIRSMAQRNDWIIISAVQFNRNGSDKSDVKMTDIAESSGISMSCDTILGIIQDTLMHSKNEYFLKILKIRDGAGKNTKCKMIIDWNYLKLSETDVLVTTAS